MRYIDADALIDDCNGVLEHEWNYKVAPNSWADAYELFKETLENAPTADVVEASEYRRLCNKLSREERRVRKLKKRIEELEKGAQE